MLLSHVLTLPEIFQQQQSSSSEISDAFVTLTVLFILPPVLNLWGSTSQRVKATNVAKRNVNRTLAHFLLCKHFFLSRSHRFSFAWLFNTQAKGVTGRNIVLCFYVKIHFSVLQYTCICFDNKYWMVKKLFEGTIN